MRFPLRAVLGALCAPLVACGPAGDAAGEVPLHVVRRGPLPISVRERGELQAARDTRVSSELEGRNTLIYLVEEGSIVAAGEKLAELDASAIEEKRSSEAIAVARARALLEQARKNVEILEKELTAAEKTAENRVLIARMRAEKLLGQPLPGRARSGDSPDEAAPGTNGEMVAKLRELLEREGRDRADVVERHERLVADVLALFGDRENLSLQMGEMANLILQSINEIGVARADLELSADTLEFSKKLFDKGFLTKNELDRDDVDYQRNLSQITLALNNLDLLVHYTLPESSIETRQELENAALELESVRATGDARRVREQAELASSEAEYALAEERLANWTEQIEQAVMFAPTPGLVVYGRFDWDEPVYEGMEVRQRQEIVILPDVTHMVARVKVHEAQIDKVASGQIATVRVDAFPGRLFGGKVHEVSALPDPQPGYRSDVKLYTVRVDLDGLNEGGALRPGMNATVEIDVGTVPDVLTVPMPAIERHGEDHYVWRAGANGPEAVRVVLGSNNLTHVEVLSGLNEGDRVHLVRPDGVQVPEGDRSRPAEPDEGVEVAGPPGANG